MASKHSVLFIALPLSLLLLVTSGSGARFNHQISDLNPDIGCFWYVEVLECKNTEDCAGPCYAANFGAPVTCFADPGRKEMVCCCYQK